MGIYDKLDRFLPFDRFLDPMFGGGGQAQPPRMVPQRSMMGPGVGGEMPQPRMQASPARPEKKVPKVSKLRVLDRVLGGQTFSEALDYERARPMQEERARQLAEIAQQVITDPRERLLFETDQEEWAKGYGIPPKPAAPAYVEGPDGIYERGEGGWTKATSYPGAAPKPPERIEGPDGIYERGEDGQWKKVANFGAAPRVFAPPRVGGGRAAGAAPAGSPAMSAIEAELKRRGLIK